MKTPVLALLTVLLFPALVVGGEKETTYLKETMIPLAREFLQRIGQTNDLPSVTNQVKQYKVDYFDDRAGCMANMRLTNGCVFSFHTETNHTEVWSFHRDVKTYYELEYPPKQKVEALRSLNSRNKLNKEGAAVLAAKYFKLLGHQEENFHPLDFYPGAITQGYWVSTPEMPPANERLLPYYRVLWYRKDVKSEDLKNGNSNVDLKSVSIEVSGIDSSLISYSKGMLPIGSDF